MFKKEKLYSTDKARKLLIASIVAASTAVAAGTVLDVGSKAEASTDLYYYERYTVQDIVGYTLALKYSYVTEADMYGNITGYRSFIVTVDQNNKTVNTQPEGDYITAGQTGNMNLYSIGPNFIREFQPYIEAGTHLLRVSDYDVQPVITPARGSHVGQVQASGSAYPVNGKHSDGYWYVRGAKVNNPPTVKAPIDNQHINGKGNSRAINLGNYFQDADGDTLTYSVSSSNPTHVSASVSGGSTLTVTGVNKGGSNIRVTASDGKGGTVSQIFIAEVPNTPPTVPTLNVPTEQFEHGDKHIISWNSTDIDNDPLTYTLQVSYSNGAAWEDLYTGPNKTYEYTVPDNQTNVIFRVNVTDGSSTNISANSTSKSIRKVLYYWNKFNTVREATEKLISNNRSGSTTLSPITGYTGYRVVNGEYQVTGSLTYLNNYYRTLYSVPSDGGGNRLEVYTNYTEIESSNMFEYDRLLYNIVLGGYTKGTLAQGDIQAGLNAYQHGQRNPDGFWYERGQRVLSEDTTPPIIELTEQTNYGITSTVTVKTHDLGTVTQVKWMSGNQSLTTVKNSGTTIATGQGTASSFIATANGMYTVYAVDNKGNEVIQTIEVTKVNTAPVISSVEALNKFEVIDENSTFKVRAVATDSDGQPVTLSADYNNGHVATANAGVDLELLGSNYTKGFYTSPINIVANDGIIDSSPMTLNNHIVIRVDDASDYIEALANHTNDANSFTIAQHQAFYDAYESVLAYEAGRTTEQYTTAKNALVTMATLTGVTESDTLSAWHERLDVVYVTVALEKAESTLMKDDYETALTLQKTLVLESNKELLRNRLQELTQYHLAEGMLLVLEEEVTSLTGASGAVNEDIVNWETISNTRIEVNKLTNEINKGALTNRLNEVIDNYLTYKGQLTNEDLEKILPDDVEYNPDLEDAYNDFKSIFNPLTTENIIYLVKYVNVLAEFLSNVNEVSKNNYLAVVAIFPVDDTSINTNNIAVVTQVVESIYTLRSAFTENQTAIEQALVDVAAMQVGTSTFQPYASLIVNTIKEVTEYNDVGLDETHSEIEKAEALEKISVLWNDSLFKQDMTKYIENGIPIATLDGFDRYAFINEGTLKVIGTIDDNDNQHTVKVFIGSDEQSVVTTNKHFETTFSLSAGLHEESVIISVNDGLTTKAVTNEYAPIVVVRDADLFKEMVQALEQDRNEIFNTTMNATTIRSLIDILNDVKDYNVSMAQNFIFNKVETLSQQDDGQLETVVRQALTSYHLEWLFENYLVATPNDFEMAGVVGANGEKVVTLKNIGDLRLVIADYKESYLPATAPTPIAKDYLTWLEMLTKVSEISELISTIYEETASSEITLKISQATELIEEYVPVWSTLYPEYEAKLIDVNTFKIAVEAVELAETSYLEVDLVATKTAVALVQNSEKAKEALIERLMLVEAIIHAEKMIVQAETSLQESDVQAAVIALEELAVLLDGNASHAEKLNELKSRMGSVAKVLEAEQAVVKAEDTFAYAVNIDFENVTIDDLMPAKQDKEQAQQLVNELPNSQAKNDLQQRLDELQQAMDEYESAINERIAEQAVETAESTQKQVDKDHAQQLVDALQDGQVKDELNQRLDDLQSIIDQKSAEDKAADAVDKVENSWKVEDLEVAKEAVFSLADGQVKDELTERLNELSDILELYKTTIAAIELAEETLGENDIYTAQDLLNQLETIAGVNEHTKSLSLRVDDLLAYSYAESAVTRAEKVKTEGAFDQAQTLVNELKEGKGKSQLQERLDLLKESVLGKDKDLVDKIIDTPNEVTSQELADYTDEMVYDEILNDYIDEFKAIGDSITKEQVVEVVRIITALEKAKRSLIKKDIDVYETIYNYARNIIDVGKYPQPLFMHAIVKHINNAVDIEDLVSLVAEETGMSIEEIIEFMNTLKLVEKEMQYGSYVVRYVNESQELLHEEHFNNVEFGSVAITPYLTGFELVGNDDAVTFELNAETSGRIFTFEMREKGKVATGDTADVEITKGSYTIEYRHFETKDLIFVETIEGVPFGEITIEGKLDDYEIMDEPTRTFTLSKENMDITEVFLVEPFVFFEHVEESGTTTKDVATIKVPLQEEQVAYNFMKIASTNDLYLSFTQSYSHVIASENHKIYLANAFYALEAVKNIEVLGVDATQAHIDQAYTFINKNLHDGEFKAMLLSKLGLAVGEAGKEDLTPVYPYKPAPVVPKPPTETDKDGDTDNKENDNNNGNGQWGGGGSITPPSVIDTAPTEIDEQLIPEKEVIVTNHKDGNYHWTLDLEQLRKNDSALKTYVFKEGDITIEISLEEFDEFSKLEVLWVHLGEEHYKLTIQADGEEFTKFKNKIKLKKEHSFSYLVRGQDGNYSAMPHKFIKGVFNFETNNTLLPFYFSKEKRTFNDINNLYSKDAIENLASRYIVFGTTSTTYSPYQNITRSQFSAMITRALGLEANEVVKFADTKNHWAGNEIQALYELGIVKGMSGNTFNPGGELTRKQAILMIYRLLQTENIDLPSHAPTFEDNHLLTTDEELQRAAGALQALKIFEGDNGFLNPNQKLTRTQMAKVLERTLQLTDKY